MQMTESRFMLCASLREGAEHLPSYLMHTCKTHKERGNVSFRPVHGSSRHAFTGIMSWISMALRDALRKWKHFVGSSDDFLDCITNVVIDKHDVFLW